MNSPRLPAPDEILSGYIARMGLKATRQRQLILEAFLAARGHVSADDLLAQVRAADPRISTATVYRTLKLLTECGLANAQQFGDGQTRYEPAVGRDHHDHLLCTRCGAIAEFEDARIEALQASIAQSHGFRLERHKMDLYGTCRDCQAREAPAAAATPTSDEIR